MTVRLAHLDAARGPGCDLEVRGWGIEAMWVALPSLRADALAFLNRDFDTRFGVRFGGWASICDQAAGIPCVDYPTPPARRARYADGTPGASTLSCKGAAAPMFPPNATRARRHRSTTRRSSRAASTSACATAPDGGDAYEPYSAAKVAALEQVFPDCGGGWQIYWRQSIPGLGNRARNADGTPMKNWWPLLFY